VFVKGGVLTSASGRSTLWRDGRVEWQSSRTPVDPDSTNTGPVPIEIICVNLKPVDTHAAAAPDGQPKYRYLNYPNIPGEDLLENDWVIVQRFTVNPGQWEGVHAHHPDMLYIHIKGGQWAARSKTEPEHAYPEPSPDGEVGWMPTIPLSVGHESRNIGNAPIDLIWVTLKK
jgi:mannose-6-phosphate isomerase-like protein (cupin superfamily)